MSRPYYSWRKGVANESDEPDIVVDGGGEGSVEELRSGVHGLQQDVVEQQQHQQQQYSSGNPVYYVDIPESPSPPVGVLCAGSTIGSSTSTTEVNEGSAPTQRRGSRKGLILIIVALVLILVGAAAITVFALQGGGKGNNSSTSFNSNPMCTSEEGTFKTCLDTELNESQSKACLECTNNALSTSSYASCDDFNGDFCPSFKQCDCGSCTDEIQEFVNCNVGGATCTVDCSDDGDSTTGQCVPQQSTYQRCLAAKLSKDQSNSCVQCTNRALKRSSVDSCNSFNSDFCPLFNECTEFCGECAAVLEQYVDCTTADGQCGVNCGTSGSQSTCDSQKSKYLDCFHSELTALDASNCATCTTDSIKSSSLESCEAFASDFCASYNSCSCGSCTDEVEEYVDCIVREDGKDCGVSCSAATDGGSTTGNGDGTGGGGDQCSTDMSSYKTCLSNDLTSTQAASCIGCVNDAIKGASKSSCSQFEQSFCPDFTLCSCGSCFDELEGYVDCLVGEAGCSLNCANSTQDTHPTVRLCGDDSGGDPNGYQICLDLTVASGDELVFESASSTWSSKVTGDLDDVTSNDMDTRFACSSYPAVIDDLYICGQYENIDGAGGVLGQSAPIYTRISNSLPISGLMSFDTADIKNLKSQGTFEAVILHEMGHVLGVGTIWKLKGLMGKESEGCPYYGQNANREWQDVSGCSSSIPIETDGGDGTKCGHWDEDCLENELMTGYLGNTSPIFSRITIATMEDMGYSVDYSQADSYTSANISPTCSCRRRMGAPDNVALLGGTDARRKLSPEGSRRAREHGLRHLSKMREIGNTLAPSGEVMFVGDRLVTVLYEEEGHIYRVHVGS